jgi:beta-N-acetylhexosaminidase
MGGAKLSYPPDVAPVEAIRAGADQLLVPPQMDTAYGAVLDAVRDGTISKKRLDESVYRVLMHKYQRGIFADPMVDPAAAPMIMGAPQHLARAQAITDHTTTLVKNDVGLLPLATGPRKVLVAGWGVGTTQGISNALAARGATTQVKEFGLTPTATNISDAAAAAQDSDLVVVSTNNAYAISAATGQPTPSAVAQTQLVRALLATGKPVVVAAMRNPYDVASFAEAPTVLDTYGYTTHQVESLVRVLFGEVNPTGRLPVSIPRADGAGELFAFGHGLRY